MFKNINDFLNKPLNVYEEKQGTGVVQRVLRNKKGEVYYIVKVDMGDKHSVEAVSSEYASSSPVLDIGATVNVTYFRVGKHVKCEIKDDTLITNDDIKYKKVIYFVGVGLLAIILFAIFKGANAIF